MNENCMEYRGVKYNIGTRVKLVPEKMSRAYIGTLTSCIGRSIIITYDDGFYNIIGKFNIEKYEIEIIEPIYYQVTVQNNVCQQHRKRPPSWDVEVAWIWYFAIMFVLAFFKARLLGWAVATIVFFGWKSGFINGGKK